jgi:tripartite ATP-independent transporter DctM subunit
MTLLAVPAMLKRKYDKGLATGLVCAGGSLGILIPPSVMLVMYGPMANLSVARLFAGALFPGLLLSFLFLFYIALVTWLRPNKAPAIAENELRVKGKKLWLKAAFNMLPAMFLIIAVLGSIIGGIASPTEASGVGCLAALVIAAAYRQLTYQSLREAVYTTLSVTAMVLFIIMGAAIFNSVFLFLGGGELIKEMLMNLPLGKWFVLFTMMFIIFIGGFFISYQGLLFIVVPVFLPVVRNLGFNPIWFAILVCVNLQMSFLTPPFAYAIFFLKGVAPKEVKTTDIYRGVIPFVVLQAATLFICIVFPEIILWLPRVTLGGR